MSSYGAEVYDSKYVALCAGRKLFRDGKPCPPNIWSDAEWRNSLNEGMCRYLGWMMERGIQLMKQWRIREWAEDNGDLPS